MTKAQILKLIEIYERNLTVLEPCDWDRYEYLCAKLKEMNEND